MQPSTTTAMLRYYSEHSAVTDPKEYAHLYDSLPADIMEVSKILQNILLHNWKTYAEGIQLSEQRRAEIEIRPIACLLARLQQVDDRAWVQERPRDTRVVVDCRHFATLLCSVLRQRGVPARTRHGFAAYLAPGHRQSHVICEYWDAAQQRWARVDPDTVQHDMSSDSFMAADDAWRRVRAGEIDPMQFGYAPDTRGSWCARWEVVRDFAALNKQEMLTFDIWGINTSYTHDADLAPNDVALLDHITALLRDEQTHFAELCTIYERDERVRVPVVITSRPYTTGLTHTIDLTLEGSMR